MKMDFGELYWKLKIKNVNVFWTLTFFFVPNFGVPKGI